MRLCASVIAVIVLFSCTHSRNNPCDEEGSVFDPGIFGVEAREPVFEMGWVKNPETEVCGVLVDRFEASRRDAAADGTSAGVDNESNPRSLQGYLPWTKVKFDDARKYCENTCFNDMCKRICKKSEFILACRGGYATEPEPLEGENQTQDYPYGNEYDGKKCNGEDKGLDRVMLTGENIDCFTDRNVLFVPETKAPGLYDLTGNIAEWVEDDETGEGIAVGGSWKSGKEDMSCESIDDSKKPGEEYEEVGFRCCK
ncbi:MAG: SUMF1/EgtB/PvdO family nonheme iron enzyme [Deltaproteobacteria bacterium]|nr:SUMF1/EgtB/PvdO family nonheme iron enzyme [Deltaproteobacteria bacterium]